jgi:predicted dehydrogenase
MSKVSTHQPASAASTTSTTKRCRVVVFGVGGNMGKIRCQLAYESPRFTLCGVSDVRFDKAQELAERYETTAFPDFDSIIETFDLRPVATTPASTTREGEAEAGAVETKSIAKTKQLETLLDAIIVSVPTDFHGVYIRQAAKYGLGVFVEKPVAETPDEICDMYDLCSNVGVQLCCGFQRRFDPSYVVAAKAVHQHKIGDRPISAHIFFGDSPGPPIEFLKSAGGEIFMDLCVHGTLLFRVATVKTYVITPHSPIWLLPHFCYTHTTKRRRLYTMGVAR